MLLTFLYLKHWFTAFTLKNSRYLWLLPIVVDLAWFDSQAFAITSSLEKTVLSTVLVGTLILAQLGVGRLVDTFTLSRHQKLTVSVATSVLLAGVGVGGAALIEGSVWGFGSTPEGQLFTVIAWITALAVSAGEDAISVYGNVTIIRAGAFTAWWKNRVRDTCPLQWHPLPQLTTAHITTAHLHGGQQPWVCRTPFTVIQTPTTALDSNIVKGRFPFPEHVTKQLMAVFTVRVQRP